MKIPNYQLARFHDTELLLPALNYAAIHSSHAWKSNMYFYMLSNALKKQLAANSLTLISKDNSNLSLDLSETDRFSCMARTGQKPLLLLPREEKRERCTPFTSATEGLEGTASNPLFLEMLKLLY